MILKEIAVDNFGVFLGHQRADLSPACPDKPIVLFGGLNGAGKTTLLEALQLALYGKLATLARRGAQAYDDFLSKSINRKARASEGASVEVAFRTHEGGAERDYRVRRTWSAPKRSVREHLDVYVDGKRDPVLSETWAEQVEKYLPARLSPLFFFDGERIESLADPDQSRGALAKAIFVLLGVDLVDQLSTDLSVIIRRKQKEEIRGPDRQKIQQLEDELQRIVASLESAKQQAASVRGKLDRSRRRLEEKERLFEEQGGGLLKQRHELEKRHAELTVQRQALVERLCELAGGALPLVLVGDLLRQVAGHAHLELEVHYAAVVKKALEKRDKELLKGLREHAVDPEVILLIRGLLNSRRPRTSEDQEVCAYLGLSPGEQEQLGQLLDVGLGDEVRQATKMIDEHLRADTALDDVERKLNAVPDEEALGSQMAEIQQLRSEVAVRTSELESLDAEVEQLERRRDQIAGNDRKGVRGQLEELLRSRKTAQLESDDNSRVIRHADRVRGILGAFREAVVKQHALHLEHRILESYQRLLRKRSLLSRISIDPVSCALTLYNCSDQPLSPERLSAGERQLLAVSMLWGLAQTAGRQMPIVVDTPLGRLDTSHRTHIVERYFPQASHQVILLSTDEEIDQGYLKRLAPAIGRTYMLTYDDERGSSVIEPGYFWKV